MNRSKSHFMTNGSFLSLFRLIGTIIFSLSISYGQIYNIDEFLEKCPTNDPAYNQIRNDFEIRKNGILVGDVTCNEPISNIPISDYTDELIILQGLRTIYYMDRNMSNHLPWTNKSLYDWLKSKVDGFNIKDGVYGGHFSWIDGKPFCFLGPSDDFNRGFDRTWRGISGNIDFYMHEARHRDGYSHVSCCGITNGCDQSYDETDLTAYGIQYWLNRAWLTGEINVGIGCLSNSRIQSIASWHLSSANDQFRNRFCDNLPPLLTMPGNPGGDCPDMSTIPPLTPTNFSATVTQGIVTLSWNQNTEPDLGGYNIFRGTINGGWKDHLVKVGNNITNYNDLDLNNNTTYYYEIDAQDIYGNHSNRSNQINTTTLNVLNEENILTISLDQNYPNPFNPNTTITFKIPQESFVNITIYNSLGDEVKTILNDYVKIGEHNIVWNGKDKLGEVVSGGTYFCQLTIGDFIQTKKMILLK